jgi:AraC-like DNA-binding protein
VSVAVETARSSALWDKFAAESSDWFSTRFEFQLLGPVAFAPQFEFYPGDGVSVSRGVMPALRVTNRGSSWPDAFFQVARADQESVLAVEGRGTLRLAPGELVVCAPEIAGDWTIDRPYTTAALHIDEGLFRRYIPNPMDLVGRSLELPEAVNDILSRIIDTSLALARQKRFDTTGRSLACSFLNMLALTPRVRMPEDREERSAVDFRRAQIKTFIQENYAKPGLSTEDIANHLEITSRYVQIALASEGLTPSEYLKVCRLQAARRLLSSAALVDRSITEIAFECGFTSSAHFSTEFRKCFGASPRTFRRTATAWRGAPDA